MYRLALLLLCSGLGVEGWVSGFKPQPIRPATKMSPPTALSALNRRNFVSSSAIIAAGLTLGTPKANAVPTGAELITPGTLVGKTMVITGASTGLGLESARDLAKGGATVVLTARSDAKGTKAVAAVQESLQEQGIENPNVSYVTLDLDNLDNVKGFPARFKQAMGDKKIDVLINNAGVMAIPERQLTKDGYERTFQSNHLGHFALTAKLVPFLSQDARIINVSSLAYNFVKSFDFENVNSEITYGPWKSYGASKLANIYFSQELQRRIDAAGKSYQTVCLHPGAVNTDLGRNMVGEDKWGTPPEKPWEKALMKVVTSLTLTPDQGAATQVYLAASAGPLERGAFYNNLKPERLPSYAQDRDAAKKLWDVSESMAGVKFDI